ncbi:MAG: GNAT family N-acetyltransferase [Candidatus Limnocylindrales bacterium]
MPGHPWPLYDLRLRTPRLELRLPTDDDLLALARLAREGIVEEGETPFLVAWHELPSPAFERQFLLHCWRTRASWRPTSWQLGLVVLADGRPIGIQDVHADDFSIRRVVESGSWLGRAYQRQGFGTEMRAAILWLAFEGLGAQVAESGYMEGNTASARVSQKLGYVLNGDHTRAVGGKPLVEHKLVVTCETWRRDLVPVTVEGLEPCLKLFGVGELGPEEWATF